jgi:copper transport protein
LTALAMLVALLGARVPPAVAHAVLVRSDPAQNARLSLSPPRVDLFFSESLNHSFSTIQVRDSSGGRHDKGNVQFTSDPTEMMVAVDTLQPGFYTVIWTTVSAVDGHRLDGSYPFTVLNADGSLPSGAPPPPASSGGGGPGVQPFDAALRWLLLLGLIGVTGGFGFAGFVLYPAALALDGAERTRARGGALWLLGAVVPAAAIVVVAINAATLVRQAELDGSIDQIGRLLSGRSGTYWIMREALAVVAGLAGWFLARREAHPDGADVFAVAGVGFVASLGALVTMSLTSHAAAGTGTAWAVPSDFLHLAGVSLWLGSLVQLPALLRIRRGLSGRAQYRWLGTSLHYFSVLALCSVVLVLLSGTFNALVQLPSWSSFTDTAYGQTLLVKLVLVALLLLIGLLNAVRIARRFERSALEGEPDAEERAARLARSSVLESLVGSSVIAVTAVLVFLVPATSVEAQNAAKKARQAPTVSSVYRNQAPAGDLTASLTVSPNRVGQNDFKVLLQGPGVDAIQRVQLRFQSEGQQVGGSTVDATAVPGTPGLYDAQAANFSFVGRWRVTANVRRTGFDDVNGTFSVEVPDVTGATTSAATTTSRSITAFPAHGITREQAWGAVLIAAGVLLFVFRRPLSQANQLAGAAGMFAIAGAVIIGAAALVQGRNQTHQAAAIENPVPADQRSIADGKALYEANCAVCHGATGHGDGPGSAALNPKPVDLTVHVGLHPDSQLYDWITNGISRTAMPAWKSKLSDQQRWDVINYLRTLSPDAGAPSPGASPAASPAASASPTPARAPAPPTPSR